MWDIFSDMRETSEDGDDTDHRLARRVKSLRVERGWSLDELARQSGVSRATLSRLENAEVSPTASVLGRLCAAYGLPLSRLMMMVEDAFPAVVGRTDQAVWHDPDVAFARRMVSPPARTLAGEVIACTLGAGVTIDYETPPRPGLEHHLVLVEGALAVTVEGTRHALAPGDCLRYRLHGASRFETPADAGAHYLLFMV